MPVSATFSLSALYELMWLIALDEETLVGSYIDMDENDKYGLTTFLGNLYHANMSV